MSTPATRTVPRTAGSWVRPDRAAGEPMLIDARTAAGSWDDDSLKERFTEAQARGFGNLVEQAG